MTPADQVIIDSAEYVRQKLDSLESRLSSLEASAVKRVQPFDDLDIYSWWDPSHDAHVGVTNSQIACLPDLRSYSHLHIAPGSLAKPVQALFSDGKKGVSFLGANGLRSANSANSGPATRGPGFTCMVTFELSTASNGIVFQYSAAGGGKRIQVSSNKFYITDVGQFSLVPVEVGVKYVVFISVTAEVTNVTWFRGSESPVTETFPGSAATHIGMTLGCGSNGEFPFNGIIGPCAEFDGELTLNRKLDLNAYVRGTTDHTSSPPPQSWLTSKTVLVGTSVAQNGGGGVTQVPWPVINNAIGGSTVDLLGTVAQGSSVANPLCATVGEYQDGKAVTSQGFWPIHGSESNSFEQAIIAQQPDRIIWWYGENSNPYSPGRVGSTAATNDARHTIAGAWHAVLNQVYAALPSVEIFFVKKWRKNDPAVDQMIDDIAAARPEQIRVIDVASVSGMTEEDLQLPSDYTDDGTHPNEAARERLGAAFRELLAPY